MRDMFRLWFLVFFSCTMLKKRQKYKTMHTFLIKIIFKFLYNLQILFLILKLSIHTWNHFSAATFCKKFHLRFKFLFSIFLCVQLTAYTYSQTPTQSYSWRMKYLKYFIISRSQQREEDKKKTEYKTTLLHFHPVHSEFTTLVIKNLFFFFLLL